MDRRRFLHVKPGKGSHLLGRKSRTITGAVLKDLYGRGRLPRARIERREAQYLYGVGDEFVFMDSTFDQTTITRIQLKMLPCILRKT